MEMNRCIPYVRPFCENNLKAPATNAAAAALKWRVSSSPGKTHQAFSSSGLFSVCARWWATRAAYGHLRWETTSSSVAPLIAHSRSGTQRQENVSTPSTGIPQQCAACTYMRKGMGQSQTDPLMAASFLMEGWRDFLCVCVCSWYCFL